MGANFCSTSNVMAHLGRGIHYPITLDGALKLKGLHSISDDECAFFFEVERCLTLK